jgi:hypothetical protein
MNADLTPSPLSHEERGSRNARRSEGADFTVHPER